MNRMVSITLIFLLLISGLPLVVGQFNAGNGWGGQTMETQCPPGRELAAISGIITASEIDACMTLPSFIQSSNIDTNGATAGYATVVGVINVGGPDIPTGGTATFSIATAQFSGCNYGNEDILTDVLAAGSGAAIGFTLDVTGVYCTGRITLTVTAGAVPIMLARFRFAVNIRSQQILPTTFTNDLTGYIHNINCDASAAVPWTAAECSTQGIDIRTMPPLETDAQSRRTDNGVQFYSNPTKILVPPMTGSIDVPIVLEAVVPAASAASATSIAVPLGVDSVNSGGTCTVSSSFTATSNTLTDGSKTMHYKRLVTFDADMCIISGTAVVQTAGAGLAASRFVYQITRDSSKTAISQSGAWTLSGIPDTQQEIQALADAVAAGIDVTICPPAAPCYHVLSGDLNSTTTIGNQTNVMPQDVNLHFPQNEDTPGMDRMGWLIFWIVLLAVFGRLQWWFALASAIPGFMDALLPELFDGFPTLTAELFLTLCLLGFCLEAAASRFNWGYYKRRPSGA